MVSSLPQPSRRARAATARFIELASPLVVAAVVVFLVWPGLMPDVGNWDTAEFQTVLPLLGTAHPTGYPTYVILGWAINLLLMPLGEPAFRMNVLSLLSVALAGAVTVHLVTRLTGRLAIGIAAGLGVALTPSAWRLATHADPHTLHLALVAILFLLLVRWEQARRSGAQTSTADRWLVAASVVFGLSVGNHSLTLLLALPVGLFVLSVEPGILRRPRFVAACVLALSATIVGVYLELPLRAGPFRAPLVYAGPDTWEGFWYVALGEQFRGSIVDPFGHISSKIAALGQLTATQFGLLAPLIPVGLLATLLRNWRYALLTGSAMLITLVFNASYSNADIGRYYLGPIFWAWTWLAILAGTLADQGRLPVLTVQRPRFAVLAGALSTVVVAGMLLVPTAIDAPLRARQADLSHDTGARQWVDAVLTEVAPDAVIVSWWSTSTVLWYAQLIDHRRPDVTVIDDRTRLDLDYGGATDVIARFLGQRPVYVIRANDRDLGLVRALYDLAPLDSPQATNVFRVVASRAVGG